MVNPLLVVALPTVYILVAVFVCLQFSVVLALLGRAAVSVRGMPQLAPVEPVVTALVDYFQRVFGKLDKFTPQPTHVLLVAIIVALVVTQQRRK